MQVIDFYLVLAVVSMCPFLFRVSSNYVILINILLAVCVRAISLMQLPSQNVCILVRKMDGWMDGWMDETIIKMGC